MTAYCSLEILILKRRSDFCNVYNLRNIVKEPNCFKNPDNPSCIDLFLTNHPRCFQNTIVVETGISDFHKMLVTVLKVLYKKQKPKIIRYRKYDNFNNDLFREEVNNEFLNVDLNNAELSEFTETFVSLLDKHTPKKQKSFDDSYEVRGVFLDISKAFDKVWYQELHYKLR